MARGARPRPRDQRDLRLMRGSRICEGIVSNDIAQISAWAREDANRFLADYTAREQKARAELARSGHEARVAQHAPAWREFRQSNEIRSLLAEIGDGVPSAEHRQRADQILGGGK